MKYWLTLILLLTGITSYASAPIDTVYLYKGQILIGEIRSIENGILVIDDVDMKLMNVKLYKIKQIRSPRLFKIVTVSKEEYFAYFEVADSGNVNVEINDSTTIHVPLIYINKLIPLEKKFFRRIHGNVGAGLSYTKSKSLGQVNLNAELTYDTKKFENLLTTNAIYNIDSQGFSRDYENATLLSIYNVTPSWFTAGLFSYQRNLELSIARRFQEMLGGGNKLLVTKKLELYAISGLAFNQERSTAGEESPLLLEVPLMLQFFFYQFNNPNIQFNTTQTTYISLSQQGRIRYSGSLSMKVEIVHNLYFNLNPYANSDNQPPSSGNTFDFGITFGLSYKL